MPRSGCSALHGVNPNLKESSRHKYFILSQKSEKRIPGENKRLNLRSLFVDLGNQFLIPLLRGYLYGGELPCLGGLACLGEMIFIPRSY